MYIDISTNIRIKSKIMIHRDNSVISYHMVLHRESRRGKDVVWLDEIFQTIIRITNLFSLHSIHKKKGKTNHDRTFPKKEGLQREWISKGVTVCGWRKHTTHHQIH